METGDQRKLIHLLFLSESISESLVCVNTQLNRNRFIPVCVSPNNMLPWPRDFVIVYKTNEIPTWKPHTRLLWARYRIKSHCEKDSHFIYPGMDNWIKFISEVDLFSGSVDMPFMGCISWHLLVDLNCFCSHHVRSLCGQSMFLTSEIRPITDHSVVIVRCPNENLSFNSDLDTVIMTTHLHRECISRLFTFN